MELSLCVVLLLTKKMHVSFKTESQQMLSKSGVRHDYHLLHTQIYHNLLKYIKDVILQTALRNRRQWEKCHKTEDS